MPAFGSNAITVKFALRIKNEPVKGFRLSDRIVSAIDRFVGALSRFIVPGEAGVMTRWLFIYPFVGGKDWTHALNLADVAGNFQRFKITWSGSIVHDALGVTFATDSMGNTNCDCADAVNNPEAWNRKSHGFYCRSNFAAGDKAIQAFFTEPINGWYYNQGIHPRYYDGKLYGDLVYATFGSTYAVNRTSVAIGDSLGLYSDNQRGTYGGAPIYGTSHYTYKRGVYVAGDSTSEIGMGYGTAGSGAWMLISGAGRNLSFVFSTKHTKTLEGSMDVNGGGGMMPGTNSDFNYFVEQLQVALLREV